MPEQIQQHIDIAGHLLAVASRPVFKLGRSGWRISGRGNDDCRTGVFRVWCQTAEFHLTAARARQQLIEAQLALQPGRCWLGSILFDFQQIAHRLTERILGECSGCETGD